MYSAAPSHDDVSGWNPETNRSVLVVEDDRAILDSLATLLRDEGFYVFEARNGQEALGILRQEPVHPSLIFLDMLMPVMNGPEFLAELESQEDYQSIPVALLSAAKMKCRSPLVVATIAKPVDLDDLVSISHRLTSGQPLPSIAARRPFN